MTDRGWLKHRAAPWALVAVAVLILLNAVAFLALLALRGGTGDVVLSGVQVEDEAVEGLTRVELAAVVGELAEERRTQPVRLTTGPEEVVTDRSSVGVEVDEDGTTEDAWRRGRRGLWRALWDHLRARTGGTVEIALADELDEDRFERWSQEVAEALSRDPRPAGLGFEVDDDDPDLVEVVVTEPVVGRTVEPEDVRTAVADAIEQPGPSDLELEADDTEAPAVTEEDLDALLPVAELAVSAPVVLVNPSAGDDLELRPADLAAVLEVVDDPDAPEGERLSLVSDGDRLAEHLGDDTVASLGSEPVEAEIVVTDGEVDISGGTPGLELDLPLTAQRVVELATRTDDRQGELAGDATEPSFTREEAEELGIVEEVSTFSTPLTPAESRNTNIQRAAELLRGQLIGPGQRFSLDETLGPRTRERGFVENGFIEEDGDLGSTVGGGTSQVATTFVNAAWFAGVEIVEFQPHSQYFGRYPEGRESTISRGTIDVVIRNDSPHGILLWTAASEQEVTISFWSTSWAEVDSWTGDRQDVEEGDARDGFTVEFGRTITYPDGSSDDERYTHRYEAQD